NIDLWIANPDGSDSRQLTADAFIEQLPVFSADGRYIVFVSNRAGDWNLWRIDADGNNLKQLTEGAAGDFEPNCTPDGQWVIFSSRRSGNPALWKVSLDGGTPIQLTNYAASAPVVSPDGKTIACVLRDPPDNRRKLGLFSIDGGAPIKTFDSPFPAFDLRWTPDGRAVSSAASYSSGFIISNQSLDGSKPVQLV